MARANDAAYWSRRMKLMEDALKDHSFSYVENMERQFMAAQAEVERETAVWYQRFADNNEITLAGAKRLLTSVELAEFRWTVGEYIAYGRQNALDGAWMKQLENASARAHISRLEAIKLQIQQQAELLYANQLDLVDAAARAIYLDSYYHTAFEVQRGLGVGWTMHAINEKTITKVLSRPWTADDLTFRDKCWTNKQALVNSVNTQLTQMIIRGEAPDKAIAAISHQFKVSRDKAGRLIMTEAAAFSSAAQRDCYGALGVERYKIVASFDQDICGLCGAMDGKVFKLSDYQVGLTAPPFHPWCRCCTAPYFEDMAKLGERWTRDSDGTTSKVPAGMSFEEWKGKFVARERTEKDALPAGPFGGNIKLLKTERETVQERVILDDTQVAEKAKALAADVELGKKQLIQGQGEQISALINKELGYDGLPKVVSSEEFASLADGRKVLYRGLTPSGDISAEEMAEELKRGKFYAGRGIYGCGTYASFRRSVAESYANEHGLGVVLEMLLADDALVADYAEILKEYDAEFGIGRISANKRENWQKILGDVGKYASIKGYDAIAVNEFQQGHDYTVVLNRGKLIIKE